MPHRLGFKQTYIKKKQKKKNTTLANIISATNPAAVALIFIQNKFMAI